MAEEDLYAVLAVDRSATPEQIKRAYFKMVRRHPPEKDPEGFKRVQAAYDVLSQPVTRKEYDDASTADPETKALLDHGRSLLEQDEPEALSLIKRALVRQPDSCVARDLLTQALLLTKDYEGALQQARRLVATEPSNPAYSTRVGDVLRTMDKDADALPYYRKAVLLDPANRQNVVKLARLLNYLDQESEAIKVLESSIHQDGKVDFDDFVLLECLCTIYVLRERYEELVKTQQRIREIIPPDSETHSYVAWCYYRHAISFQELGNFEAAIRMIEEAAALDASLPDMQEMLGRIRLSRSALADVNRLKDDAAISPTLKLIAMALAHRRVFSVEDEEIQKILEANAQNLDRLLRVEGVDIAGEVRRLQTTYTSLAHLLEDFLGEVKRLATVVPKDILQVTCPGCGLEKLGEKPSPQVSPQMVTFRCERCQTLFNGLSQRVVAPSSDCFVVTAACGDENAYPVRVLRIYRDHTLAARFWGPWLISVYRRFGPLLARWVAAHPLIRRYAFYAVSRFADWVDGSVTAR